MRVGSLFAGIGGFDLAAERAGMEVVWQSEIDKHASRVLDHHWPHIKKLGDIHGIGCACNLQAAVRRQDIPEDGADFDDRWSQRRSKPSSNLVLDDGGNCEGCGRARPPGVDVLTGGFPCQDYSVAGTRGGLAGDRGALWWEYHRLITGLRPTWVVGENVPGLLSSRDGRDFETIVRSLTEFGYGVAWAVLDAQYFGVAQRRRRVFIVGHSGGVPRPEVLALSEGVFGHPEPSRETGQDLAGTLETRPTDGRYRSEEGHLIAGFNIGKGGNSDAAFAEEQAPTMTGRHGDPGGVATIPTQPTDSVRRLTPVAAFDELNGTTDEVHHNLRAGTKQSTGVLDRATVRRLTPLECERLQGFPDGWTDIPGNSDTQRYRQLGNAIAVPVGEWVMRQIVLAESGQIDLEPDSGHADAAERARYDRA